MSPAKDNGAPRGFGGLGLVDELSAAVSALGYEEATPVQREAIPLLIAGKDLLAKAATGTGKTAAFALPMLQTLFQDAESRRHTGGLVLVPTRELSMQVAEAIHKYAKGVGVSVVPVYGGAAISTQIRTLERGAGIVVATPGRALDHIRRGTLKLAHLRMLVLDEADEMLDMGFAEDLDAILDATPKRRQTALFSATMPSRILSIAQRHLKDPARVTIASEKTAAGKLPRVRQTGVPRAARPQAGRPRPRAGHGESDVRARVLPHASRSRVARRDAERARPPRASAARRDGTAAAGPRHADVPRRQGRSARRHRRRRPRPRHRTSLTRRQLRRARVRGGVCPPHWPHGTRGPRRHGHHARRAARASSAAHHRGLHEAED